MQSIPDHLRTTSICLAAVQSDGEELAFVPDSLKTPELCLEAVHTNGLALQYVPDVLKTIEICLEAILSEPNKDYRLALAFVPDTLKTKEFFDTLKKKFQQAGKDYPALHQKEGRAPFQTIQLIVNNILKQHITNIY